MGDWFWNPVIGFRPMMALALLFGGLAMLVYLRAMRRQPVWASGLMVWRLVMVVMLLGLLAGPSRTPARSQVAGASHVHLLVDMSGSMRREDVGGQSRWSALGPWLNEKTLVALEQDHQVSVVGFHDRLQVLSRADLPKPAEQVALGRGSSAMGAMAQLLQQIPQGQKAQIVWLGDGRESEDRLDVLALAKERQVVIHAVSVGGQTETPDLAVKAEPPAAFLMSGEEGKLRVVVRRSGQLGPQKAQVSVSVNNGPPKVQTVQWDARQLATEWVMPIQHAQAGRYRYRVRVKPMANETVIANNLWEVVVRVAPGPLKVLVLEAEPFWDTKFLAQALRRDRRLVLHQITQIALDRPLQRLSSQSNDSVALPKSVSDWSAYDVVILGRGLEKMLPPSAGLQLQSYVEKGGALVLARGRSYDPDTPKGRQFAKGLSLLEPVRFGIGLHQGGRVSLSAMGRSSALFNLGHATVNPSQAMASAPKLDLLHVVEQIKPSARVLAQSNQVPWLVEMGYGQGRVLSLLGEGLWRWRLQRDQATPHRAMFESFWSNVVRDLAHDGLVPGAQIDLKASSQNVRLGDPVHWVVRTRKAVATQDMVQLSMKGPDGLIQKVGLRSMSDQPERLEGQFVPNQPGHWQAILTNQSLTPRSMQRSVVVHDLDVERLHSAARPELMRRMTEGTGGLFFRADQKVNLVERLAQRKSQTSVGPKSIWVWDQAWVLVLILTWAGVEWIGRRAIGWL